MDTEFFSWLIAQGGFAIVAALMFFMWQKSEAGKETLRLENKALRDAYETKAEANTKALLDLSEKRLTDTQRVEVIASANTQAMGANTSTMAALLPALQVIAARGAA